MEALVAALERETFAGGDPDEDPDKDPDEDSDSEASSVAREVASWAARALCLEAPCAEEAFGAPAAYASFAARLAARVEAEPSESAPPLRAPRRPRGRGRRPRRRRSTPNSRGASGAFAPSRRRFGRGTMRRMMRMRRRFGRAATEAWDASVDALAALAGRRSAARRKSPRGELGDVDALKLAARRRTRARRRSSRRWPSPTSARSAARRR